MSTSETLSRPNRVTARLADPACRYMAALYDTKNCAEAPSVPVNCQLSLKVKTFVRGSFSSGTTGFGYIVVQPSDMVVNDSPPVGFTTSSSVMTSATTGGAATGTSNSGNCNSLYASSSFGSSTGNLSWKLVACTLYLKYAGTELNRGGDMILVEEPNHRSLLGYSYNTVMSLEYAKRVPMSGDRWVSVSYTPNDVSNASAPAAPGNETVFLSVNPTTVGTVYLGAYVNTAGAAQPIDYECYCWFEAVGATARGATSSYEDPIGFAAISGATEQFQQLDSVLGMDGFVHAVENQLDNMSGVGQNATHKQNWMGLAAFLPQLKEIATRALSGAANGALKEFGYTKKDKKKKLVAPLPPPPPPPPRARAAPALAHALQSVKLKKHG